MQSPCTVRSVALAAFLSALAALAGVARAQVTDCPHERATNVPAHFVTSTSFNYCREYFHFLGLNIVVGRRRCPNSELLHPAHQECQGESAYGMRCVPSGTMSALRRDCECQPKEDGAQGIVDETCACTGWTVAGQIEDAATAECVVVEG